MIFLGIDPGRSGAIVALFPSGEIQFVKNDSTEQEVSDWLADISSDELRAVIEQVHSMPKQGVASSFKFGMSYGFLRGLLTAHKIPFESVTPSKWQGALGCRSGGKKNVTKQKAGELFPHVRWTHATADAVLLAEYARRTQRER